MPYSEKQIKEAIELIPFIIEEDELNWKVPTKIGMKWLRLNPKYELKPEEYYPVSKSKDDNNPLSCFTCTCTWGTYRLSHPEPISKYCKHVIAVIFKLVNEKKIHENWADAILNGEKNE